MEPGSVIPSFIESLVGLLVFGISIPSILINVPPRIKAIRDQYSYELQLGSHAIKASQFLQPEYVVALIVLSIVFLLSYLISPFVFDCTHTLSAIFCSLQNHFSVNADYWITGTVILNVIATALFIGLLTSYTKDKVILHLGKVCQKQAASNRGCIEQTLFDNLGELGEFCDAGRDKQLVFGTIERLLVLELTSESWAGFARAVRHTVSDGNEQNITAAIELLQDIMQRAVDSTIGETHLKQFHLRDISKELESVFLQAFTLDSPLLMAKMMQGYDELTHQSTNDAAKAFFRIGRIALRNGALHHAVMALGKLHTQISELLDEWDGRCPPGEVDALNTYFALVAYFWDHGPTMREHVLSYLEQLQEDYEWDQKHLSRLIQEAGDAMHFGNLETADHLVQMLFNYRQLCLVKRLLTECRRLSERCHPRILAVYPSVEAIQGASIAGLIACGLTQEDAEHVFGETANFLSKTQRA